MGDWDWKKNPELKITIDVNPRTKKNNPQMAKKGNRTIPLPSKAYKEYEKECAPYLEGHSNLEIDYPINVKAVYYRRTKHRIDLCNLHEALCDVLVRYKIVKDDNVNIIKTMDGSRVEYNKEWPRTEITITRSEDHDRCNR